MSAAQLVGTLRRRFRVCELAVPTGSMSKVQRIGYAVLALELAVFGAWSAIQYRHFALTWDFAVDHQAWVLIAHGNLDPYSTTQGFSSWRDHSEFLLWPLAAAYWVWPHGITLLWLQDLCVAAAEMVVFTWLCELIDQHHQRFQQHDAIWMTAAGLVLLAANPWLWWSVSFDFHIEAFATLFAVLLAYDLAHRRNRVWVWVVPLLACGDVAGTYLVGIGIGAMLGRGSPRIRGPRMRGLRMRGLRMQGAALVGLGLAGVLLISLVHGNEGSSLLDSYGYLAAGLLGARPSLAALVIGIIVHPFRVLGTLWVKRVDLWASLGPAGLVGVADPLALPLVAIVVLANLLFRGAGVAKDLGLAAPSFQFLPVYLMLPMATVAVLMRLLQRRRRLALLIAGLLAAQTLGWAVVWGPRTSGHWLRVSAAAAATLASVEGQIPASAGVIASNGVIGRLSGRAELGRLIGPGPLAVYPQTWFIISPWQGVESESVASAMALIGELAGPLHATLVTADDGIWVFRWTPPADVRDVTVPGNSAPVPAWAAVGTAGQAVLAGPVSGWHMAATGGRGYVVHGVEWQEPPGRYAVAVTLSASAPVNVEVWDNTKKTLLARRTIAATAGVTQVALPVHAPDAGDASAYSGWGPFRAEFVPPPPGQQLEVRVWSAGGRAVNVYRAELTAVGRDAMSTAAGADRQPARADRQQRGADFYGGLATRIARQSQPLCRRATGHRGRPDPVPLSGGGRAQTRRADSRCGLRPGVLPRPYSRRGLCRIRYF